MHVQDHCREHILYEHLSQQSHHRRHLFLRQTHTHKHTRSIEKNKQTIENTFCVYTSPSRAIIDGIFCFPVCSCVFLCVPMCVPIENTFYISTSPSRAIIDGIFCFPAPDSLLPSSFSPPLPPPPSNPCTGEARLCCLSCFSEYTSAPPGNPLPGLTGDPPRPPPAPTPTGVLGSGSLSSILTVCVCVCVCE
jgi:hypothetical protein